MPSIRANSDGVIITWLADRYFRRRAGMLLGSSRSLEAVGGPKSSPKSIATTSLPRERRSLNGAIGRKPAESKTCA